MEASEADDVGGLAELMAEDARFSMPQVYDGRDTIVRGWVEGGFGSPEFGDMRCVATRANRQPAVACYVRRPGDSAHRALSIDVLRIAEGLVAEINTFGPEVFPAFGLPAEL
jgi:RNA polymerase sigma-70 factor (ECF subfamily)